MNRFLYESSVSHRGYLIIPFSTGTMKQQELYSYQLLCELGNRGKFHQFENPAELYSNSIEKLMAVAKQHLNQFSDILSQIDYFQSRYTYRDDLIIIHHEAGKYFYDHYKPDCLKNIAAPKIFKSEQECISWVKTGLDQSSTSHSQEQ